MEMFLQPLYICWLKLLFVFVVKNQVEDSNDFNSSSIYARYKHVRLKLSEETNELIIILYYSAMQDNAIQ